MSKPKTSRGVLKALLSGAIILWLLGAVMIFGPAGRIPLTDANRTPLAETSAEGYCAAEAHFRGYQQEAFDECVDESNLSKNIDHARVPGAFCDGVLAQGWPGSRSDCLGILESQKLWPTVKPTSTGWLSNSWNRKFPYPGGLVGIGQVQSDSRTGDRDGNIRDEVGREGEE